MSKTNIDPKVREFLSKAGKKGGKTNKAKDGYFSELGSKSWQKRIEKYGRDGIAKKMAEASRKGVAKRLENKKKRSGLINSLDKLITGS